MYNTFHYCIEHWFTLSKLIFLVKPCKSEHLFPKKSPAALTWRKSALFLDTGSKCCTFWDFDPVFFFLPKNAGGVPKMCGSRPLAKTYDLSITYVFSIFRFRIFIFFFWEGSLGSCVQCSTLK